MPKPLWLILILLVILTTPLFGGQEEDYKPVAFGVNPRDVAWKSAKPPAIQVDAETLGLSEIRSILFADWHTAIVAGATERYGRFGDRDIVIISVDLQTSTATEIIRYKFGNQDLSLGASDMLHPDGRNDLAAYVPQIETRTLCLVSVYRQSMSGMRDHSTRSYVQVVVLRQGKVLNRSRSYRVNWVEDDKPHGFDETGERDVTLLRRDVNNDGFDDLVIWRHDPLFRAESREERFRVFPLLVMTYDPETATFSEPVKDTSLPIPNKSLWK